MQYILFKIHCSKLKPDPVSDTSQAAKICKSHRVLFFCVSKNTFNSFLAAVVKLAKLRSMSVVLGKLEIAVPEVFEDSFCALGIGCAFAARGAVFAYVGLAFEFAAAVASGRGIA